MKKQDIKQGEIYWTFLSSSESNSYGDTSPVKPYQAKADYGQRGVLNLRRFDQETGAMDHDTNAETMPKDLLTISGTVYNDVYLTEAEALVAYRVAVVVHVAYGLESLAHLLKTSVEV